MRTIQASKGNAMHQSPQKQPPGRRDKDDEFETVVPQAQRHANRGGQPKARRFSLRDEAQREQRAGRQQRG
jgi:hypothetical protein